MPRDLLPVKTVIRPDGLRYESKAAAATGWPAATMSCLLCGRHQPRSMVESFVLAGARQFRCRGGC